METTHIQSRDEERKKDAHTIGWNKKEKTILPAKDMNPINAK